MLQESCLEVNIERVLHFQNDSTVGILGWLRMQIVHADYGFYGKVGLIWE